MNIAKLFATALCATACAAWAQPVSIASWNLGWHVSQAEVAGWIDRCSRPLLKDESDGIWKPVAAGTQGATVAWYIKEPRAKLEGVDLSVMPPCGVYQTSARANVAVTPLSFSQRSKRIGEFIRDSVTPDVIAFQEVSGTAAVVEALGPSAADFEICSFDGQFKVQRLAFAWRKSVATLAEPCRAVVPISLPHLPAADQLRPGFQVGLTIRGKLVRFLNLHLKSGCVSALDGGRLDTTDVKAEACRSLQQQVRPLEAAIEQLGDGAAHFVVLGDFNRNLWHELHRVAGASPVRSDGSTDLKAPLPAGVRTQNLLLEVNDAEPGSSQLALLAVACSGAQAGALCEAAKTRKLTPAEGRIIAADSGLGCRNGVGLDHFLVSSGLEAASAAARKLSIGRLGQTFEPARGKTEPVLAISDHCPIVAQFNLK